MAGVREPHDSFDLRDGREVWVRRMLPDDAPRLVEAYDHLSRYSAYQRFFTVMKRLPPDWARVFANVDYRRRLALIAEDAATGALIAVARYEMTDRADTAEKSCVVVEAVLPVTVATVVQLDPSVLTCSVKSRVFHAVFSPPAPACLTTNRETVCAEPRSTCSHFDAPVEHHLSLLPPVTLPLTAFAGVSLALHDESAVAALPSARFDRVGPLGPYASNS